MGVDEQSSSYLPPLMIHAADVVSPYYRALLKMAPRVGKLRYKKREELSDR